MVFGAAPFSGTQARNASGMWVTPGHWLLTPERSLVLVWCLHSANFAFVSAVKVSPHYKSHLRSHTSSAQSPFACAKIWESQWEAPASYATCYHNTINDWSHDNNHQTTNTLIEQLHLMLLQKAETFLHDVWSRKQTDICSEEKYPWQIWFCFTRFNIQHRSSSICPALGLVKVKVKLVRKRLHFVFEMSTWSYDFHINPLLKCSQRAGCVEMQILCEPVTSQTYFPLHRAHTQFQ